MNYKKEQINQELRNKTPFEIIEWALSNAKKPVLTTNFGPYSGCILHAITKIKNDIKVIWCDTGYNTQSTYKFAIKMIESLNLNIEVYVPKETTAFRDVILGIPQVNDPKHKLFTEQVKLEPFKRAMTEHQPDVWFTNLRKGQTAFRDTLDIVTQGANGVLKVSPFYHFSDEDLNDYLQEHKLSNEVNYFDPTKVLSNRECGIHL